MPSESDRQTIGAILEFWFAEETKARWYDSTKAFDEHCCEHFGELTAKAAAGDLDGWESTAEGALALCLLLDQMPRNIHRSKPEAFATDPKAVEVATRAIERGLDQALDPEMRKFLYLPFMHSERLTDQERSVAIAKTLDDENTLCHANDHADVIGRFGRFPHRNAILGRENTAAEQAFLEAGANTYGQSAADED